MFFALNKLKIAQKIIFVFIQKAVDKMSLSQFMYFLRSVRSPIFTLLVFLKCVYLETYYCFFLFHMVALSKIMTAADS